MARTLKRLLAIAADSSYPARPGCWKEAPGFAVEEAGVAEGLNRLAAVPADAVLAHLPIPDWPPDQLLEAIQSVDPLVPVVFHQPRLSPTETARLVHLGAWQCVDDHVEPADWEQLAEDAAAEKRLRELSLRRPCTQGESWKRFLVGESRAIRELEQIVGLVGPRRCTVLITGETGTGKEMLARALHTASPRSRQPMVSVNCGALPPQLLEAELFGHVRGAFTGAIQHRVGRFEQARGSTLFLDEVGEIPLELQVKLLRVLQERAFERLGSSETVRVDVRVIAASNADLPELVRQGRFREDLYYRLNVVPVHLPPLRERCGDVPLLVHHFLAKICEADGLASRRVTPEALDRLSGYAWPGNVRELENAVERAIAMSGDRLVLYPADFPLGRPRLAVSPASGLPAALPGGGMDLEGTVRAFEAEMIAQALAQAGGNKTLAAELLGLRRTTLLAKLHSLSGRDLRGFSPGLANSPVRRRRAATQHPSVRTAPQQAAAQDCFNTNRWTFRSSSTSL
ncbi:MAG TPA: sigma-54 dependent transcriptional regulator [Bryobacteraceae bacterium]|nr:sigma-54 dependent transcriptional regulator [Bryobacteraceae bacterium]